MHNLKDRLKGAVLAERNASIAAITVLYSQKNTKKLERNGNVLLNLNAKIDGKLFRSTKVKYVPLIDLKLAAQCNKAICSLGMLYTVV